MGLLRLPKQGKQKQKLRPGASRATSKITLAKQLSVPCAIGATLSQDNVIAPGGQGGDAGAVQGHQIFGFDNFDQVDFLGVDTWTDECQSYCDDWAMAAPLTLLPVPAAGDKSLNHPPTRPIEGQLWAGNKDEAVTEYTIGDMFNQDVTARISELPERESGAVAPSMAPNLTPITSSSPSQPLPNTVREWSPTLGGESLPPPVSRHVPKATSEGQNSAPHRRYVECKTHPSGYDIEVNLCHGNTKRSTQTPEMTGQNNSISGYENMTTTSDTLASSSDVANSGDGLIEPVSIPPSGFKWRPTLVSSCTQLPSPHPTEQTSPEASPPAAPPPHGARTTRATPHATSDDHRRPAETGLAVSRSSHRRQGLEEPIGQPKRRYKKTGTDEDARNDGRGTAKRPRLQEVKSSRPPRPANDSITKRSLEKGNPFLASEDELQNATLTKPPRRSAACAVTRDSEAYQHNSKTAGLKMRELAHPRSLRDSTPRAGSRSVHSHRQPQNPQARLTQLCNPQTLPATQASSRPKHGRVARSQTSSRNNTQNNPCASADHGRTILNEPYDRSSLASREIPTDGCSACGFCAKHLVQLTDMVWKWVPKDDSVFEALFKNNISISDTLKSAVMLRLCLGSIRNYAMEMVTAETQSHHPIKHTVMSEYGETPRTDSVTSNDSDSFSDDESNQEGHSDLSEDERSGDSNSDHAAESKRPGQPKGARARWTSLNEQRLKSYVKENKDWPWIARQLGRTKIAIEQH